MCCAFNKDKAEDIFVESRYASALTSLEREEKANAFEGSDLPDWYTSKHEPVSQPGMKMGLTVMLDAHTDILTEFSVSSDFEGFTAVVTPPGINYIYQP
jgi:hypothetical protein